MEQIPKVLLLLEKDRTAGRDMIKGISDYANIHGPWIIYTSPPYYISNSSSKFILWLKNCGINGIITLDTNLLNIFEKFKIPTIVSWAISRTKPKKYPIITCNDAKIGKLAADYFIDKGFTNFAFCGFDNAQWSLQRNQHLKKYLKKAGFNLITYNTPKKNIFWEQEISYISDWIAKLPKPLALIACNDERARQVLDSCRLAKILVPDEVAVLGIDNDSLVCSCSFPHLSSVSINHIKAGFATAELLDKMMKSGKSNKKEIVLEPIEVITRQSSDITAIEDRHVAEAVNFIRQNVRKPLQIDDVANAVTLPRRTLYDKFKKHLHRTVHDEIKRLKIQEICKLLRQTTLSISEIAEMMNFESNKHISRYFYQEMKTTPKEYTKKFLLNNR